MTSYKRSITPIVGENVQDCVTFNWIKIPTSLLENILYISILYKYEVYLLYKYKVYKVYKVGEKYISIYIYIYIYIYSINFVYIVLKRGPILRGGTLTSSIIMILNLVRFKNL